MVTVATDPGDLYLPFETFSSCIDCIHQCIKKQKQTKKCTCNKAKITIINFY